MVIPVSRPSFRELTFLVLHWGLTPKGEIDSPEYRQEPMFAHLTLTKAHNDVDPSDNFATIRRPRLDRIDEPSLARISAAFYDLCFHYALQGLDGLPETTNSFGDVPGVLTLPFIEAFRGQDRKLRKLPVYHVLRDMSGAVAALSNNS